MQGNHTIMKNAENLPHILGPLEDIKRFTLERNHIFVKKVGNSSVTLVLLKFVKESLWRRAPKYEERGKAFAHSAHF